MSYCNFCGQPVTKTQTECPYEGLCFIGLTGQPITTVPKLNFSDPSVKRRKIAKINEARAKNDTPPIIKVPIVEKPVVIPTPKKKGRPKKTMTGYNKKRTITMYNLYGEAVQEFKSVAEAARLTGFFPSAIRNCVLDNMKNHTLRGGATFRFSDDLTNRTIKYISHYKDGKEVGRYSTAGEAGLAADVSEKMVYNFCSETQGIGDGTITHLNTII